MGAPDDYNTIHCHKCGEAEDPSQYDDAIGYRLIDHDECFHCFFEEHDYVTLERKPTPKPAASWAKGRNGVHVAAVILTDEHGHGAVCLLDQRDFRTLEALVAHAADVELLDREAA